MESDLGEIARAIDRLREATGGWDGNAFLSTLLATLLGASVAGVVSFVVLRNELKSRRQERMSEAVGSVLARCFALSYSMRFGPSNNGERLAARREDLYELLASLRVARTVADLHERPALISAERALNRIWIYNQGAAGAEKVDTFVDVVTHWWETGDHDQASRRFDELPEGAMAELFEDPADN